MNSLLYILYFLGLALVWTAHVLGNYGYYAFAAVFALSFLLHPPRKTFSPLSIFYAYYGAWFVVAPMFATRYQGKLMLPEYSLSSAMAYTVFGLGMLSIAIGTEIGSYITAAKRFKKVFISDDSLRKSIPYLYFFCTTMIAVIISLTGGMQYWLQAPGDAFLNRGGSGLFVILSHFSSIILAAISGYLAFKYKKQFYLLLFFAWVFVTSPVHGSKLHISLLIIIALLPYLRNMAMFSLKSMIVYTCLFLVFILGLYFRNVSWMTIETVIPYAFNYFSTLDNLAVSVRDFQPSVLTTFFLPFVKFQTPFGLSDPKMYFDMNHLLTDIYLPTAWKIRATEQWPVETDLYLNFMFFGGLPLVALYLGSIGFFYGMAQRFNSLGNWLMAFLMIVFMISHLRGSLYNHTDFYMYPYMFLVWVLFYNCEFDNNHTLYKVKNGHAE